MPAADVSVSEIADWDQFLPLREEWNELLARSQGNEPFLRHEWLDLWWRHFGAGRRPAVLVARRDGRLVAALPLMEERASIAGVPVRALRSMTNQHSFRFNGLGAPGEEEAVAALWDHLARRPRPWQAIVLEEVPADAPVLASFFEAARRAGAPSGTWHGADVPYLAIEGTYDDYHASLSQKFRANLRRRHARLAEQGEVSYRCVSAAADVPAALQEGLPLEGSGWKARAGSAIASDPALTSFYAGWAAVAAANGWLRLSFLDVAGKPVAFDYSTLYDGRCYNMKMGYDPAYDRFSVGQLLKSEILRACFAGGTREYDFLGAVNPSKEDWKPRLRSHEWRFLFRPGPVGRLLHFLKFTATPAIKRRLGR